MKQLLIEIERIKRLRKQQLSTNSPYMRTDIEKAIKSSMKEIKFYCYAKGYSWKNICKQYNL